jgi:hypothetical protein
MATILTACPESGHLEKVDVLLSPLGVLVRRCSAFPAGCPMTCRRTCAAHLDLRMRARRDIGPGSVLEVKSVLR